MSYQRPTNAEQAVQDASRNLKPDPTEILIGHMRNWMAIRKQHRMPAHAPDIPEEAAPWWISHMQEPEHIGETNLIGEGQDNGSQRWDTGYANRISQAFLRWADMTTSQRETVRLGVIEDKVPYRGDTFAMYMTIHGETLKMHDMGIDAYREQAKRKLGLLLPQMTQ